MASKAGEGGFLCPYCGGLTNVNNTRRHKSGVYRRRDCLTCKERFSTLEMVAEGKAIRRKGMVITIGRDYAQH